MTFTPGPWRYLPKDNVIVSDRTARLIDVTPRSITVSERERNANGYLIAAAPELLDEAIKTGDALRSLLTNHLLDGAAAVTRAVLLKRIEAIETAITKAETGD